MHQLDNFVLSEVVSIRSFQTFSINCYTFFQICCYYWACCCKLPLTWFTTNAKSLQTKSVSVPNFIANLRYVIKFSYFASLFVALNPNWRECSTHSSLGLFNKVHPSDPSSLDKPSTYNLQGVVKLGSVCFEFGCSKVANSSTKSNGI